MNRHILVVEDQEDNRPAVRVASEFGHKFAFSGALQEYLILGVHRNSPPAKSMIDHNSRGRSKVSMLD